MIVFATCNGNPEKFERWCKPGVEMAMAKEPHLLLPLKSNGKDIHSVYQEALVLARHVRDLEALVLLHDDVEIKDPGFADDLRAWFSDQSVGIVGCIGARNVRGVAWWEGDHRQGYVQDDVNGVYDWGYEGFGDVGDVSAIDGMIICLSPTAVRELTLEGLGYYGFHGYTEELCAQAKHLGLRVRVAHFEAPDGSPGIYHHTNGGYVGGDAGWKHADENFKRRWPNGI